MSITSSLFGWTSTDSITSGVYRAIGGQPTHAGPQVNEHQALQLAVVYAAVSIISDAIAQLPIDVIRREGDEHVPQPDHRLVHTLNREPNQYMTSFTFRNTAQSHALLWGNTYSEIIYTRGGQPTDLFPILPDRTVIEKDGNTRSIVYRTNVDGQPVYLNPDRVLHIPGMGFDGLVGYSPIHLARNAIGLGLALEEFGSKFFANDMKSGGYLKHPSKLSEEAQRNIVESVERQGGLNNAHRLMVLQEGMEFQTTTIAPEDAQFLSTRSFQVEEIARMYRIPLFMLGSHAKDTAWGSGLAEQSLGFVRYTLRPWLVRWEQELNRKMLTEQERRDGYYIKHNLDSLLAADAKTRAEIHTMALDPDTGWMMRNEVRGLEDYNNVTQEEWEEDKGISE